MALCGDPAFVNQALCLDDISAYRGICSIDTGVWHKVGAPENFSIVRDGAPRGRGFGGCGREQRGRVDSSVGVSSEKFLSIIETGAPCVAGGGAF